MAIEKELGNLPLAAVLACLINNQDDLPKLKFLEVETTEDFYFEEVGIILEAEDLLKVLIELDGDGDPAIRIGFHSTTGSTKLSISELDKNQLMRLVIGKTSDGKPYLRAALESL